MRLGQFCAVLAGLAAALLTVSIAAGTEPTPGDTPPAVAEPVTAEDVVRQIVAWDSHTHGTEPDPTCPTCYARANMPDPHVEIANELWDEAFPDGELLSPEVLYAAVRRMDLRRGDQ